MFGVAYNSPAGTFSRVYKIAADGSIGPADSKTAHLVLWPHIAQFLQLGPDDPSACHYVHGQSVCRLQATGGRLELIDVTQAAAFSDAVKPRIRPSLSIRAKPLSFGTIVLAEKPPDFSITPSDVDCLLALYFPVLLVRDGHIVRFRDAFQLYRPPSPDRLIDAKVQNLFGRCYSRLSFFGLERVFPTCPNLFLVVVVAHSPLSSHVADFVLGTQFSAAPVPGVWAALSMFGGQAYLALYFDEEQSEALRAAIALGVANILLVADALADLHDLLDPLRGSGETVIAIGFSDSALCAGDGAIALLRNGANWSSALAGLKLEQPLETAKGLERARAVVALALTLNALADRPGEVVVHFASEAAAFCLS
jgi:hypothetical protein